jgi:hypothetical protein
MAPHAALAWHRVANATRKMLEDGVAGAMAGGAAAAQAGAAEGAVPPAA